MKQILILLISVILFSCSDNEIRYHIDETTSPTDTLRYLKLDMKPINGIVYCEFGENGNFINGKSDGEYKFWYESGNQQYHHFPINDSLDEVNIWFENGQLKNKYTKKGWKKEGEFRQWYDDGSLQTISNYKDNKEDGEWKQYYRYIITNGYGDTFTMSTTNYKDGKKIGESIVE